MPFHKNFNLLSRSVPVSLPLLLLFAGIYVLSIGTRFYSSDAQVMYATGRALAFRGTVALQDDYGLPQIRLYPDGFYYSQYDPGMALLAAPVIRMSDILASWQMWNRYAFAAWMVRWISALAVAAGLVGLFHMALSIYADYRLALVIVFAAGLCTPVWVYARLFFTEGLLAGLLTLAFWNMYRGRVLLAGLCLGMAILTRAAMSIYLLPLVWLLWRNEGRGVRLYAPTNADGDNNTISGRGAADRENVASSRRGVPSLTTAVSRWSRDFLRSPYAPTNADGDSEMMTLSRDDAVTNARARYVAMIYRIAVFMIFPILAALGLLYHNAVRGGDPFAFGYAGQGFDTFLPAGVYGLLLSPGKGVFVYAPPLILSLIGWRRFWRRERHLAEAMLLAAVVALLFYGKWWAWHGGWSWGPRFVVPLIPVWMLPAGEALRGIRKSRLMQVTAGVLLAAGFAFALIGVGTDVNLHYARQVDDWIEKHDYKPGDEVPAGTPRDVVNYTSALPVLDMLRFALDGRYETPGILHLRSMGWQTAPAVIFPIVIVITIVGSMVLVVRVNEQ